MRKRSKYRPKGVRIDSVNWVVAGLKPLAAVEGEAVKLKIVNHDALEQMRQGQGTRQTVDTLIEAMNMTEALLSTANLGTDWSAEIRAGQDALFTMSRRAIAKGAQGRFVFTGPELVAINLAMEIHDAQLDACTVAQLERAIEFVRKVVSTGNARRITA